MTCRFMLGFAAELFSVMNLISAHLNSDRGLLAVFERDGCADDSIRVGWALAVYERGGFDYRLEFNPSVLLIDL